MFSRPGSGRPMLSQVLRPMTSGLPIVAALNRLRSVGRRQGNPLSRPMTPFSAMATNTAISMSDRDRRPDRRVGDVVVQPEIVEAEGEQVVDLGIDPHPRQRLGRAAELLARLVEMVGVEVRVAERVDEARRA